jgi:glutathione peroxidase
MHGRFAIAMLVFVAVPFAAAQDSKPKDPQADKPAAGKPESAQPQEKKPVTAETATSALDFTMKDIDGKDVPLSKFKGKVVLIVNVASKCGFTPQYEQLEALHKKYAGQGLVILGFPANEFKSQEPGTNAEIKEFCTSKYGVEFDMFSKVVVKGPGQCELYKLLTSNERNGKLGGEIQWNFTKFLLDRGGKAIDRFEPKVRPDDPKVVQAIEAALKGKP